ncbi:MAG: DUF2066 domain-containing protein [Pseudomonadales bacterium]|nr:DUF2066 domain-containing protein [Pseudomonadales bacterium]
MKFHKSLVLVLLSGLAIGPLSVLALPVNGLYRHEVAVENQSEQERNRAFREALAAVIVKVTGERRWLENVTIETALGNAGNFVEAIESRTESRVVEADTSLPQTNPLSGSPALPATVEQELLNVSFARDLIDQLLARASIPVWDSNRPGVLVWMAIQNDVGERRLLSPETDPGIMDLMREFAKERGLPILFPVLDFEDRRNLTADVIWALDEETIARASARYAPDSILSGRLLFSASGDLVGLWQFQFQDQVEVFDSIDTELASYIEDPLNRITSQLARHFAVVPSTGGQQTARLRVEGIGTLAAYAELVSYLEGLVLVEGVTVAALNGEVLELNLTLQGSQGQLSELLSLDRNLAPLGLGSIENPQVLTYRWAR